MQIIIDIDEEEYIKICEEPCTKLAIAVANGIPLLEGHSDLISREDVLNLCGSDAHYTRWMIEKIPSVTPKQRVGKWIQGKCNQCGEHAPHWSMASTYYKSNYCPNCGTKMEVNADADSN